MCLSLNDVLWYLFFLKESVFFSSLHRFRNYKEGFPPLNEYPYAPFPPSDDSHLPTSPYEAPSFIDPPLLKFITIFTCEFPISPSTLPLESIRHENVTIQKARRPKSVNPRGHHEDHAYLPLSVRIEEATRSFFPTDNSSSIGDIREETSPTLGS